MSSYTLGKGEGVGTCDQKILISIHIQLVSLLFMVIVIASISPYVYKYVIHIIAISYAARDTISPQIMDKHHRLLCTSTLLYLYCIYFVLLYLIVLLVNMRE